MLKTYEIFFSNKNNKKRLFYLLNVRMCKKSYCNTYRQTKYGIKGIIMQMWHTHEITWKLRYSGIFWDNDSNSFKFSLFSWAVSMNMRSSMFWSDLSLNEDLSVLCLSTQRYLRKLGNPWRHCWLKPLSEKLRVKSSQIKKCFLLYVNFLCKNYLKITVEII